MKIKEFYKKHKKIINPIFIICIFGVFIFAFLNLNATSSKSVETEIAKRYTYSEVINTECIVVRNEDLLEYNGSKVLYYTANDGDIVGAGSQVAYVFANETDALNYNRLNEINKQIEVLESLNTSHSDVKTDYSAVDKLIEYNITSMISAVNGNSLSKISKSADDLVYSINQRQIITGKVNNFNEQISALKAEAASYKQSGSMYTDIITPGKGGYFVASADGYENCYDYDKLTELTVDDFTLDIKKNEISDNTIGKIVSGLNWYIVCKLDADEALTLSHANTSSRVTFANTTCKDIPATLVALNQESRQSDAVAVFRCNYMNTPISHLRNETVQITVNTYNGLRVSKSALHDDYVTIKSDDGAPSEKKKVQGVYVTFGNELEFKEVSILYAGADFVILDENPTEGVLLSDKTVKLNEEVVIKGDDLYDGKSIK